jgi:hypothetical protein
MELVQTTLHANGVILLNFFLTHRAISEFLRMLFRRSEHNGLPKLRRKMLTQHVASTFEGKIAVEQELRNGCTG